jgi:hypothetical protein
MEVSGQLHAPAALPPGKEPLVPIEQEARWVPETLLCGHYIPPSYIGDLADFRGFPIPPKQILGQYLKIGECHLSPHASQHILSFSKVHNLCMQN